MVSYHVEHEPVKHEPVDLTLAAKICAGDLYVLVNTHGNFVSQTTIGPFVRDFQQARIFSDLTQVQALTNGRPHLRILRLTVNAVELLGESGPNE